MEERNYFTEIREKLIKAGVTDEVAIVKMKEWLYEVLTNQYQKGSDDAARIYNETLKQK